MDNWPIVQVMSVFNERLTAEGRVAAIRDIELLAAAAERDYTRHWFENTIAALEAYAAEVDCVAVEKKRPA